MSDGDGLLIEIASPLTQKLSDVDHGTGADAAAVKWPPTAFEMITFGTSFSWLQRSARFTSSFAFSARVLVIQASVLSSQSLTFTLESSGTDGFSAAEVADIARFVRCTCLSGPAGPSLAMWTMTRSSSPISILKPAGRNVLKPLIRVELPLKSCETRSITPGVSMLPDLNS